MKGPALAILVALNLVTDGRAQPVAHNPFSGKPNALIDVTSAQGARLVNGTWRYSDAKIVEVDFRAPGQDRKPSRKPIKTFDHVPKAQAGDFDDSNWEVLDPTSLDQRRSTGKLCFNWYRLRVTIPARVGEFNATGSTVVLEVVIDDYAEIWVNGKQPRILGQSGGPFIRGFNAPNRVGIGRDVKPGQQIQLAIFDDPRKELPFSGVFCLHKGKLRLVSKELTGPNGLGFSPDAKYMHIGNWDEKNKVLMRYEVEADGMLSNGTVFFDMTPAPGQDALDGLKVDRKGDLYASGPGGLWILSSKGKHLGTIKGPEQPHNLAWGEDDGQTLYLAAQTGHYRIRLGVPSILP